ncbi:MAG: RNA polymerase sigma factor [Fibrobacter sp.]|nr:RNA polymerase sigma factor [Fibrobacter sp.]
MMKNETETELRSLYERYASMVHRRCRSFLKSEDEAWDATQDVFMKLHNALPKINKKESIYSWLLSASTNHCISQLRKKKTVDFNEEVHSKEGPSLPQEKRMLLNEIFNHFLKPYDQKVQEVVIYTYFDGYKQEEIARITGLGESTIRRYLTNFKRECSQTGIKMGDLL